MVTTRKKSPVKKKTTPPVKKVVPSRRMTLIKAGVTNLNKLPSFQKYKTKALTKNVTSKNTKISRSAPNPYAPKYTWAPWGTSGVVHDNCYDYAFGSFSNNRQSKSVPGDRSGIRANGLTFRTCDGIAKRVLSDNPGTVYKMKTGGEKPKVGFYKVMCFVAPSNDFGNSTGDFHWYKEISSIRYRTRPGDTLDSLGKFFHVRQSVLQAALAKAKRAVDKNDGRVANDDQELRVLNKHVKMSKGAKITPGKVIEFPVKLWSHKTGWAGGPLIVDASGKTITDPRKADRDYKPGFHYSKFCSAYGVRLGLAKTGANANRNGKAPRANLTL
jgi:hypothetical protein